MSELKPQGNYTLKQMQQSAKIASTADGIEISGNQFKVTELQACPDMLLFACEKLQRDEWISVDENNNHPDPEKHKIILGIDMKDSEPYVFECEWDGDTWSNIGGESFTHWKPSVRPK